jgi:hypothetical protein
MLNRNTHHGALHGHADGEMLHLPPLPPLPADDADDATWVAYDRLLVALLDRLVDGDGIGHTVMTIQARGCGTTWIVFTPRWGRDKPWYKFRMHTRDAYAMLGRHHGAPGCAPSNGAARELLMHHIEYDAGRRRALDTCTRIDCGHPACRCALNFRLGVSSEARVREYERAYTTGWARADARAALEVPPALLVQRGDA